MNDENLKTLSPREARENGRKGGIASAKARRERKSLAEALRKVLDEEVGDTGDTRLDIIVKKAVYRLKDRPSVYDLEKLQHILGEQVIKVDVMSNEEKQEAIKAEMEKLYGGKD